MMMQCLHWLTLSFVASMVLGCEDPPAPGRGPDSTSAANGELSPEEAAHVLAQVGDRAITLGDFVMALERMDRIERIRYQTPERRKMLLDEMIDVELLAREAERRGLDDDPQTQAHIRLLQKDELMRRVRRGLPKLDELPASEVRSYYDDHKPEFVDPERRRVAVIKVPRKALAEEIIEQSQGADAERWGELARKHSTLPPTPGAAPASKNTARPPLELEGDLGLVSAPGQQRGTNPKVPAPIRKAVFEISEQGAVLPEPVSHDGAFFVVRLVGKSAARQRTFSEAEQNIRARLLQERLRQAEARLIEKLQKEIPVTINDAALAKLAAAPATKKSAAPATTAETSKGEGP